MADYLVDTFCELVKIPSPSGQEREVARYIRKRLSDMGITSYVDSAGKKSKSNTGNVIAKIGKGSPRVCFVAHMDTVEDGKKHVKPIVKNGTIKSDGTTILGADDKASVAVLLSLINDLKGKSFPAFLCVFTIREEAGLWGAKNIGFRDRPKFIFDVDGSGPIGMFVNKALGFAYFDVHIYGKETHAAAAPEKGHNAIKAAAIIAYKLKLGKYGKDNFLNIGTITGGSRDNVIPGYCLITALARCYDDAQLDKNLNSYEEVVRQACEMTGCTYKFMIKESEKALNQSSKSAIVEVAKRACLAANIPFILHKGQYTIQANSIAANGYAVLGMVRGGKMQHAKNESIKVKEMLNTKQLLLKILSEISKEVP